MIPLRQAAERYLSLRQALGFKLKNHAWLIRQFVAFAEGEGARRITIELALCWAKAPPDVLPATWGLRLAVVRQLARHLSATDPKTEIPPPDLLPGRFRRRAPYLYSDQEIRRLLRAACGLPPRGGLRRWSCPVLIGLLAVTGLRLSEALALDRDAVDLSAGMLTIRRTKFGKSRFVPLHPSTVRALRAYAHRRDRLVPRQGRPAFFLSDRGQRLSQWAVRTAFNSLSRQVGLRGPHDRVGPRLHDFRHRFAVRTLVGWYRAGRDVERLMPLLSTFLGHTHVADTYWYLSAAPELLRLAGARLEKTLGDLP